MAVNLNMPEKKEEAAKKKSLIEKINLKLASLTGVSSKEILFFLDHLRIMMKAGIPLSRALRGLSAQSSNKNFGKIIGEIANDVEKGVSFTDSLKKHQNIFGELFINMVEAGEVSGKLDDVLAQLYLQTKKSYELKSKIKGALTYPIVILCAMLGIGIFMMIFVVPKITAMFSELKAELPLPTKVLIGLSNALANNSVVTIIIIIVVIFLLWKALKTTKGKKIASSMTIHLMIIGPIVKKINLARFTRTFGSLLKTEIMVIRALEIAANTLSNYKYRNAIIDTSEKVKRGEKISQALGSYPKLFPDTAIQIIAVGEETGELSSVLEELSGFYESEINQIMENLPSIIEPLIILTLGCAVGAMAIAIIMPMYSLTSAI